MVRAIGSDLHMDYTAVGQTTHLAARMEQLAAARRYPPSPPRRCAWRRALSRSLRSAQCRSRGSASRSRCSSWWGLAPLTHPRDRGAPRGSRASSAAPRSWSNSQGALDRASQGHGQVIAVVGEPGVGKSRLVWELTHSHRVHGLADRAVRLGLLRQGHRVWRGRRRK